MEYIIMDELNAITDKDKIEELMKKYYYCNEHGFIDGVDVTNDEKCAYCGREV